MSSEFDPNHREELRSPPSDYASVKYAAAVLLVAGALVAAAVTGVFNGDTQTAQNAEQPAAPTTTAESGAEAAKPADAAKSAEAPAGETAAPGDAAATGASTGEGGSDAAPAAQPAPAPTPAPEAPAAQPEQPQPAPQQ
jgi:hypothetical protein